MAIAVPAYIQNKINADRSILPPGHYYNMFFDYWYQNNWSSQDNRKIEALRPLRNKYNNELKQLKNALINRQNQSAEQLEERVIKVPCQFDSPFVTGMGNPHPLENGFSFLNPYGLPCLPGSSIKGSLRHAAELMALFPDEYGLANQPVNIIDVWLLFGFEGQGCCLWTDNHHYQPDWNNAFKNQNEALLNSKSLEFFFNSQKKNLEKIKINSKQKLIETLIELPDHKFLNEINFRGALNFWDSIPENESMEIEIMTPHYSDYYNGEDSPHDSGSPNPIPFLVIPPRSKFNLFIECLTSRLPEGYDWQTRCYEIIEFCSKWEGFGAKTAVGYGDFSLNLRAIEKEKEEKAEKKKQEETARRHASMTEEEKALDEFETKFENIKAKEIEYVPGSSELSSLRIDFLNLALEWTDKEDRKKAAEILRATIQWGKPGKKKIKEMKAKISKLEE